MIVITGASDGLGLQLAKVFNDAGKRVVNISRTESKYANVNLLTDLRNVSAIKIATQKINDMEEPIEALINCAGVISFESISALSPDEIDRVYDVNVKAPMLLTSALIDKMKVDKTDIINVVSTVALRPHIDSATYDSSKWALRGFTKNLELELKKTNRVTSFCVGGFKSNLAAKVSVGHVKDDSDWMEPADIAQFVKTIVQLPKNMEVAEIVINRKRWPN